MKKMRRLIPAVAMLMVAAVMLSTASFAWFTMNEQVSATGMQIQAQATGSLIISTEPLKFNSNETSVNIYTKNEKLKPVTFIENKWNKPDPDAEIDPATGLFKDGTPAWEAVDTAAGYLVEEELWIGSAGDALLKQSLTIDLDALVAYDTEATLAYAAAIYVVEQSADGTWAAVAHHQEPAATIYIDKRNDRNVATLTNGGAGYTIPSIVGVGAQDTKTTGLKVVVRFFVDGNLAALSDTDADGDGLKDAAKKEVITGIGYEAVDTANATFDATKAYFVKNDNGTPDVTTDDYYEAAVTEGLDAFPAGAQWFTQTFTKDNVAYNYVNSEEVPSSGTSLEISFTAGEVTP